MKSVSKLALLLALPALPAIWAQDAGSPDAPDTTTLAPVAVASSIYTPLNRHERWHGYLHDTFLGTQPAVRVFGTALLDHVGHAPTQWGVGFHGYAHRLENRLYSTAIDGTVHASLAAALHLETRYLRSHDRQVGKRIGNAFERTLFTYNDAGGRVFDVAGLGGIYAGTMLPMFWHPRGYSPLGQGVRAGNFGVMFQAGNNLIKEFRPDVQRLFAKK